jgi:hypothetical protein
MICGLSVARTHFKTLLQETGIQKEIYLYFFQNIRYHLLEDGSLTGLSRLEQCFLQSLTNFADPFPKMVPPRRPPKA